MDIYLFSLLVGFLGLTAMALVGFIGQSHDSAGHVHVGHDGAGMHVGAHDAVGHLGSGATHDLAIGHGDGLGLGHAHDLGAHGHDLGGGHDVGGHVHAGGHDLATAGHGHVQADGSVHGHSDGHAHDQAQGAGNSLAMSLLAWLSPRVIFGVLFGFGAAGLLLKGHIPALLVALLAAAGGLLFEVGVLRRVWGLLFRFAGKPASTLEAVWMELATATTAFDAAGDGLVRIELNGEIRQILARLRPEDRRAGVKVHMGDQLRVEEVDPERNECVVAWLGRAETPEA